MKYIYLFIFLFILIGIGGVYAVPLISFVNNTPSNSSIIRVTNFEINTSISTTSLNNVIFNLNNINYTIFDSSVKLFYNFENNSNIGENSTLIVDNSLYSNNATVLNNTNLISNNKFGNSYSFNGINSSIVALNYNINLNMSNEMSISFWLNVSSTGNAQMFIGKNYNNKPYWQVYMTGGGYLIYETQNLTASNSESISGAGGLGQISANFNKWVFITITHNNTNATIYMNGINVGSKILNNTPSLINSINNLVIGRGYANNFFMNGTIDNLIIWNKTLDSNTILFLYNSSFYLNKINNSLWNFYSNGSYGTNSNYFIVYSNDSNGINSTDYRNVKTGNNECWNIPVWHCQISINTTFDTNNYNINATDYAIYVSGNNIFLDCAGSNIFGNYTSTLGSDFGFSYAGGGNNFTLKNCIFNNYWTPIKVRAVGNNFINVTSINGYYGIDFQNTNNSNLYNITIYNFTNTGIYFDNNYNNIWNNLNITGNGTARKFAFYFVTYNFGNLTISNSKIINSGFYGGTNNGSCQYRSFFTNNYVSSGNYSSGFFGWFNNWTIDSNNFYGGASQIYAVGSDGSLIISNNNITNISKATACIGVRNALVFKNTLNYCDIGIFILRGDGGEIINNTILNSYFNIDEYQMGIANEAWENNYIISGNNITNYGTTGIALKNSTNISIFNNFIYPLVNRLNTTNPLAHYRDYGTPQTGILISPDYKGYNGRGDNTASWTNQNWSYWNSNNITIFNNTIYGDLYLTAIGVSNLSTDFTNSNSIFRSFQLPYLKGIYKLFLNPNFNNITSVSMDYKTIQPFGYITTLDNFTFSYYEYPNSEKYINLKPNTFEFDIYNKTNYLIYFSNGTGKTFSGDLNTTFTDNNYSYGYNNYLLSEPRISSTGYYDGEPFTLSSISDSKYKTYHIASNITNTINVPIILNNVDCYNLKYVSLTPNGLTSYNSLSYICDSNNTLTIYDMNLTYSTTSNVITIGYTVYGMNNLCSNIFSGFLSFNPFMAIFSILGILVIIIIIASVFVVINRYNDNSNSNIQSPSLNLDSNLIGGVFLAILVIAILLIISLVVVGNMCSFG
jgi:hypothetical protein